MVDFGSSVTFTGLSSGIDTGSIVTQLIAVESAPKTLLMQQQAVTNLQNADYADISTKLYTLKSAADALRNFSLYAGSPTATSGDTTRFTAAATSAAAASSYNVVVTNVARAASAQQTTTPSISQFGSLYAGNGTYAASTTKLSALTDSTGTAAGYAVGSSINLASTQGGTANSGELHRHRLEHGRRSHELDAAEHGGLDRLAAGRRHHQGDERTRASIRPTPASRSTASPARPPRPRQRPATRR